MESTAVPDPQKCGFSIEMIDAVDGWGTAELVVPGIGSWCLSYGYLERRGYWVPGLAAPARLARDDNA
jgi:hypothetical protein